MYYVAACTFRWSIYRERLPSAPCFSSISTRHRANNKILSLKTSWENFSLKIRAVVNDVYSPFVLLRYFIPPLFWIYHVSISTFPSNDGFFDNFDNSLDGSIWFIVNVVRGRNHVFSCSCMISWYDTKLECFDRQLYDNLFVTRSSKIITNRRERTVWNIYNSLRSFDLMHLLALSRN